MSPVALPTQHAAVLHGAKDLRYEQRTLWAPQHDQAQVAVQATGLCGSDCGFSSTTLIVYGSNRSRLVHYYMHGRNGDFAVQAPLVLGHEAAGVITAVGSSVTDLAVGQRVAIEAGIMCRECDYCKKGRYNVRFTYWIFVVSRLTGSFSSAHISSSLPLLRTMVLYAATIASLHMSATNSLTT